MRGRPTRVWLTYCVAGQCRASKTFYGPKDQALAGLTFAGWWAPGPDRWHCPRCAARKKARVSASEHAAAMARATDPDRRRK